MTRTPQRAPGGRLASWALVRGRSLALGEAGRRARRPGPVWWLVGQAVLSVSAGCLLSAAVGAGDGTRPVLALASVGVVAGLAGWWVVRTHQLPHRVGPGDAVIAVVTAWLVLVAASTIVYLASGGIGGVGDALFESSSGYATTSLSVVVDPGELPRGLLFWRAWTQWSAGFGALVVTVLVIPFLGLGVLRRRTAGGGGVLRPGTRRASEIRRRLAWTYVALTVIGVVAYLVGGLDPFDAVTYSLTTVSTGGFTNSPPLEAFTTARLQWAATGGMLVAGAGLALVWRGLRGVREEVTRSRELRTYATVVAVGTLVLTLSEHDGAGILDRLRIGLFTTASLVSTTGFATDDWGRWGELGQVAVVALLAVGAMSGSPGGGFRILRARVLASYARSVVVMEQHRRAVVPVTLGDTPVPQELAMRMTGYQVLWIGSAFVGAVLLAATGLDAAGSVTGSISALATVGPGLGDLAPSRSSSSLAGADLVVLSLLALAGRVGLYPALAVVPALVERWRRHDRRRRRNRRGSGRVVA